MSASPPRVLPMVLIAAALTLVVTVVRVCGECAGWDSRWFNSDAGSPFNPFGIVWLAPLFGFLFGRRAALAGDRPPFVASFFVPMFALVAFLGAAVWIGREFVGDRLLEMMRYLRWGALALALLALFTWPRMFVTTLAYAVLARVPVVVVQYLDIHNGWQTHYGKVHAKLPPMSADERLWLLTLAQAAIWVPFTILFAHAFAALGAASVRKK